MRCFAELKDLQLKLGQVCEPEKSDFFCGNSSNVRGILRTGRIVERPRKEEIIGE